MNKDHERMHIDDPQAAKPAQNRDAFNIFLRRDRAHSGRERQPGPTSGWRRDKSRERAITHNFGEALGWSAWRRSGILMITTLEMAEAPDGSKEAIPQFHVSMSILGALQARRVSDDDAKAALACLGLTGAEEDNHSPGVARHFWWPLDPKRRRDCECKTTEETIVEPDGYRWSNPKDSSIDCNGCELEVLNKGATPCTIHNASAAAAVKAEVEAIHRGAGKPL